MELIEKLDALLKWFAKSPFALSNDLSFLEICKGMQRDNPGFDQSVDFYSDVQRLIDRLVKDENIDVWKNPNNHNKPEYRKNTKGIEFYESGGYTAANLLAAEIELERSTQRALLKAGYRLQKVMVYLTVVLAFGTSVSAVYYGFYLCEFYKTHSLNWQFCAYFLSGFGLALLIWLVQWLTRKIPNKRQ